MLIMVSGADQSDCSSIRSYILTYTLRIHTYLVVAVLTDLF